MIPRVATVVGPWWESELVDRARLAGTLKITQRAFRPAQVQQAIRNRRTGAVVVGPDIPWLSPGLVTAWRDMGAIVIGVNHPYHRGADLLLQDWGCDFVLSEPDPEEIASVLLAASPTMGDPPVTRPGPKVVAVGGPRGAPGRTEVALGLAWLAARAGSCLLIEADSAPSLGLRLGLPPSSGPHQTVPNGIDVLLWRPNRSAVGLLAGGWSKMAQYQTTVIDLGPSLDSYEEWPGERVVVCDASPSGIVRGALFLGKLKATRPPWLIVNRLEADERLRAEVLLHLDVWAGKRPDALVENLKDLHWGKPPPASLLEALEPLMNRLNEAEDASLGSPVATQHLQVAHGNQVRVEHFGQAFGSGGMDQIDKETVAPRFGGGTGLYPRQIGSAGG